MSTVGREIDLRSQPCVCLHPYWEINLVGTMIHDKVENPVVEVSKIFKFRLDMDKYIKICQIFIIFRLH